MDCYILYSIVYKRVFFVFTYMDMVCTLAAAAFGKLIWFDCVCARIGDLRERMRRWGDICAHMLSSAVSALWPWNSGGQDDGFM